MSLLFVFGFMIWIVTTLYKFFFMPTDFPILKRLYGAFAFNSITWDIEFASIFQIIGYFWITSGGLLSIVDNGVLKGFSGSLIIAGIILLPVWVAAGIYERRGRKRK